MLRLTFLSILVFSGLYFFTGKPSPSLENSVAQISFENTLNTSFAAHDNSAQNNQTQIDISAFKTSLGDLKGLLHTTYQKSKSYISSKYHGLTSVKAAPTTVTASHSAPSRTTLTSAHVASTPKKSAQTPSHAQKVRGQNNNRKQKRASAKSAQNIVTSPPLPMARPDRHTIAKMKKQEQKKKVPKRVVASFRNFITDKKGSSKNKNLAGTSTTQAQLKLVNYKPSSANKKELSPRFLTSLIKRELKRLNCFGGAITPVWNDDIQRRIKSLDGPLSSNVPTQHALTYLKNKTTLRCPTLHQPITTTVKADPTVHMIKAKSAQPALPLNTAAHFKPQMMQRVNLSSNKTPAKKILLRDRSGNIISKDGKKKTSTDLDDDASLAETVTASGHAPKDKDYDFTTLASNLLAPAKRRLPPSTVGKRSSRNRYQQRNAFPPVTKRKAKKRKPRYRRKKARSWKSDVFGD